MLRRRRPRAAASRSDGLITTKRIPWAGMPRHDERRIGPAALPMDSAHGHARAAVLERLFVGWPCRVVVAQQEAPGLLVSDTREVLVKEGGYARVVGVVV